MESITNNKNIKNMKNKESSDKKEIGGNIKNIDKYIGRGGRTGKNIKIRKHRIRHYTEKGEIYNRVNQRNKESRLFRYNIVNNNNMENRDGREEEAESNG